MQSYEFQLKAEIVNQMFQIIIAFLKHYTITLYILDKKS